MLAEAFRMGGTCVIRGCVPKKLYVMAGRFSRDFEDAHGFGWDLETRPRFDWSRLVEAKEAEISRLERLYAETQARAGVEVVRARAVLEGPHHVRIPGEDRRIHAHHILIATGGHPNLDPDLPGIEHVITSDTVFDLPEFPRRILIAGGGYVAMEFAGIFRDLGAEVTILYRGPQVLRSFEPELREGVHQAYAAAGIRFILNDVLAKIEKRADGLCAMTRGGLSFDADQILFAIGRSPNTEGLGLAEAGVNTTPDGAIAVDDEARSSHPSIFAVGDVTNRVTLTPVAIREGHALADRLFGAKSGVAPWRVDYADIPTAVFTTPEIGTVGLGEEEAAQRFEKIDVFTATFRPMRATLTGRDAKIFMKLVVDGTSNRILGAHLLGDGAAELIQLLGVLIKARATKRDFDLTMPVHPTSAEELVTMRAPTRSRNTICG
jgi:glutathione reductase (NADPH)